MGEVGILKKNSWRIPTPEGAGVGVRGGPGAVTWRLGVSGRGRAAARRGQDPGRGPSPAKGCAGVGRPRSRRRRLGQEQAEAEVEAAAAEEGSRGRARRERLGRVWGHRTQTPGPHAPRGGWSRGAGRGAGGEAGQRRADVGCGSCAEAAAGGRAARGARGPCRAEGRGGAGLLAAIKCGVRRSRRSRARLGRSGPPSRELCRVQD